MTRLSWVVASCVILLGGCQNDPLIFTSTQTYGLKISISTKQDEPVKLVMGYDSNDTTLMPTTMDKNRGRVAAWTGSCITKDDKSLECVNLPLPIGVPPHASADEAREGQPEADIGHVLGTRGGDKGGRAYQYDALSVLSSFDAEGEGKAGTEPVVSAKLGKLFATGVAAQNISSGIQHDMAKAWAPNPDSAAACLELGKAVAEGKFDAATAGALCGDKSL